MSLKKGREYIGTIERTAFPNKGITRIEGDKVIVKDTLPGQKVRFAIGRYRHSGSEGKLHEIIERSPLETGEALCPHFGQCGGCSYQLMPYETQLEFKESQVKKLLEDSIGTDYEFMKIAPSPSAVSYRNKMEFSFGDTSRDGELTLGMHKKGSFYDILPITACAITNDDYNTINACVLDWALRYKLTYCHKVTHIGYLRHLLVRRSETTGEILVCIITSSQWAPGVEGAEEAAALEELKEKLVSLNLNGKLTGFIHCLNDDPADDIRTQRTDILFGQDYYYEYILGLKFKVSIFSFFQTNSRGAEVLYSIAREFIGDTRDKVVFDLYTGTGTIAQMMAGVAKKVVGVEIVEEAVEAAKENAALNNLDNCEFICGDVLKVLDDLNDKPDMIVLDPPREGIHPKALKKIVEYYRVKKIIYISCKPTSLANDLVALKEYGYKVTKVRCCDMFPQTVHVETVCELELIG